MAQPLTSVDLQAVIADDRSVEDLRRYFAAGSDPGAFYTGSRFEALSGGGDRGAVADRIVADDLVAVQMLSVLVPAPAALDLLEGACGREIAYCLGQIPADVAIGTPKAEPLLAPGGPAELAWMKLRDLDDIGWVTAGKVLARKRPHLVPVYDNVVACAIGRPSNAWTWFQEQFAADGGTLAPVLFDLRERSGVATTVSALRVLDAILWMRHRDTHTNRCTRIEFNGLGERVSDI